MRLNETGEIRKSECLSDKKEGKQESMATLTGIQATVSRIN